MAQRRVPARVHRRRRTPRCSSSDAPGDRGTEIHVDLEGSTSGGKLGEVVQKLVGSAPLAKVKDDLRHFKQRVETGEVPRSDGSPEGERAERKLKQRPAQPLEDSELREGGCAMRANVWSGRNTVQVENVPDPKILNDRDAIVQITSTAICGSDLHLYDGYIPTMEKGDILGHEFMGEVVEVGRGVVEPQGRRPRRRAVPDRLRQLLGLPARAVLGLRELEPERRDWRRRCSAIRPPGSSATRT